MGIFDIEYYRNAIGLATSKNMDIIAFGEDNNVVVWRRK